MLQRKHHNCSLFWFANENLHSAVLSGLAVAACTHAHLTVWELKRYRKQTSNFQTSFSPTTHSPQRNRTLTILPPTTDYFSASGNCAFFRRWSSPHSPPLHRRKNSLFSATHKCTTAATLKCLRPLNHTARNAALTCHTAPTPSNL